MTAQTFRSWQHETVTVLEYKIWIMPMWLHNLNNYKSNDLSHKKNESLNPDGV